MLFKTWQLKDETRMSFLEKEYNNAGFNHTDQNKFPQLSNKLWDFGFHTEDVVNQLTNKKVSIVYRIPPLEVLENHYSKLVGEAIGSELARVEALNQENPELVL